MWPPTRPTCAAAAAPWARRRSRVLRADRNLLVLEDDHERIGALGGPEERVDSLCGQNGSIDLQAGNVEPRYRDFVYRVSAGHQAAGSD